MTFVSGRVVLVRRRPARTRLMTSETGRSARSLGPSRAASCADWRPLSRSHVTGPLRFNSLELMCDLYALAARMQISIGARRLGRRPDRLRGRAEVGPALERHNRRLGGRAACVRLDCGRALDKLRSAQADSARLRRADQVSRARRVADEQVKRRRRID